MSTGLRTTLAALLLVIGAAGLAAIDKVLLPHYLANRSDGARESLRVPPQAREQPLQALAAIPPPPVATPPLPATATPETAPKAKTAPSDHSVWPRLLFIRDTAWLSPSSCEALNRLAAYLKHHTDLQVVLTGHTDDLGPLGVNKALSLQRATRAQMWLVDRGVDSAQIKVMNFAAAKPVAQGRTAEARVQNRRVEITVRGRDR